MFFFSCLGIVHFLKKKIFFCLCFSVFFVVFFVFF